MSNRRRLSKKLSPYVRYNKRPYAYEHKNCNHTREVFQSVAASESPKNDGWRGMVCATCNIILKPYKAGSRAAA